MTLPRQFSWHFPVLFALPFALSLPASVALGAELMLEEVLVTAQKRQQNLQDVSISITAFNEQDLKSLGVTQLDEMVQYVNGAQLFDDRGAGQPTWVIRGVGLADFNSNNTPTAAIFYDEYYLTSNVLGGIGLFDIAQVEVLKGPQGGLYGRNTSGGAVLVNSRRASLDEEFNGYVTTSYGEWDRYSVEGATGGALGHNAAFRLSATTDQGGGWQDSLATPGDDDHGDHDFSAARAQLLFAPTDKTELWVKLEGGQDKSETTLAYTRALFDGETGDFCAAAYGGQHDENSCVAWSNITNVAALTPGDYGILPDGQDKDGSTVLSKPINQLDNSWTGINVQFDWDLDFATFTSISGYLDYDNKQVYDYDAQPLTLFEEDGSAELSSWSQEFRLTSSTDGPLSWLTGVMYAEDEDKEQRFGDLSDNVLVLQTVAERGFEQQTESWAAYGQLDYALSESILLHGSARYTDENKDLNNAYFYDIPGDFYYINNTNKSLELDENWSGHIGADWHPTDAAMLYARITQGLKSGGFFGGFASSEEQLEPYGEETVTSYEVGFKTSWLDNTLQWNGATYFYDYSDVQGFTQVYNQLTDTVVTRMGNLGTAEHKGAELDLLWVPLEGLTVQAAAAWLDAKITDSDTIAATQEQLLVPIEGVTRQFAPEWSTNFLLRYEWNIASLKAAVQANYNWRDDLTHEDSELSPVNLAAFSQDGFGLLGARAAISAQDDSWTVALIGKNLTDEEYWTRASSDDLLGYPSTPGLPASWMVEATYQW